MRKNVETAFKIQKIIKGAQQAETIGALDAIIVEIYELQNATCNNDSSFSIFRNIALGSGGSRLGRVLRDVMPKLPEFINQKGKNLYRVSYSPYV